MSETSVKYMSNAGDSPDSTATFLRRFIDVDAISRAIRFGMVFTQKWVRPLLLASPIPGKSASIHLTDAR